ncbi:MAG: peptide ABC transporter [Alphaproteobacteria bacterium]|nr:peptide ABC transporter [Alphaproteobacteria bacterium]
MAVSLVRQVARATLLAALAGAALGPGDPARAGAEVLSIDLVNEPATLDPHMQANHDSFAVYRNIFDNLVTRDDDGRIVPQVATAWRFLSDTEVEFDIRAGVRFHDGTPLTAEDVAFSIRRIIDPALRSPQLSNFNRIVAAEATAGDKVRVRTETAYPVLLAQLVNLSIVPRAVVERVGREAFMLQPVGSGPYRFVSWQRGARVVLAANPEYWGDKPGFPRVEFNAVPDAATRMANLRTGRADLIVTLNPDNVAELRAERRVQPVTVLTERVAVLRLNTLTGPLADPRLRRAVWHAIDRDTIVQALLGGLDKVVPIFGSPASFGWVEGVEGPRYDPALAKRLVQEAGAAAQQELVFNTAPVFDQRVVQAIQQMLTEAGLKVRIASFDVATYMRRATGKPEDAGDLAMERWTCTCGDVEGILEPLFRSGSIWSRYRNPEMDAALDAGRSTLDPEQRLKAYRKVYELIARDAATVPLYQQAVIYGTARQLVWRPTAQEGMFVNRMRWRE